MASIAVDQSVDIITPPQYEEKQEQQEEVEKKAIIDAQGEQKEESSSSSSPSSPSMGKDGANNELSEVVQQQAERIKDLEQSLQDARKLIDSREKLLAALQWKPKEDYYAWKNPTILDKTVKDAQERKLKTLLEQMRVMEKMLAERDQVLNSMVLAGSNNSLTMSGGQSPFSSPMEQRPSPAAQPSWSRSPSESPAATPSPERKVLSSSWWFFKRTSSFPNVAPSPTQSGGISRGNSSTGVSPVASPAAVRYV